MQIKVSEIMVDEALYPRSGFDSDIVNRYRLAIDELPPIVVTDEKVLVDGYHRLIAHQIEQRETIEAEEIKVARGDVLWETTKLNAKHGHELEKGDKARLAREFFKDGRDIDEIAGVLSVGARSVQRWTEKLRETEKEERARQIWDMWLGRRTQEEIAEAVGVDQSAVSRVVNDMRARHLAELHTPPDSLQRFNLWRFQNNDAGGGIDYRGWTTENELC